MYYVSNLLRNQNLPYFVDIISISVIRLLQGTFEKAFLENLVARILQNSTRLPKHGGFFLTTFKNHFIILTSSNHVELFLKKCFITGIFLA